LGAVESLDLRFLVNTQHQRALGRCHVEADDVADLLDKQRIARQLKAFGTVRLQAKGLPDAVDRRGGVAHRCCHPTQ
jgi:hypothetical protein